MLLLFWLLISEVLMHVLVFLGPKRSRILLYEAVDIWIRTILDFAIHWSCFRAELLPEIIDHTRGLSNFKSSILVVVHAIPSMLSPHSQALTSINIDDLACDLSGVLRSQMDNCMADFLDVGSSSHRVGISLLFHDRVILKLSEASLSVEICVQKGRRDAVNSHSEPGKLQSWWPCHHFKTSFWHAVRDQTRLWLWALHARDVNNTALGCNNHVLEKVKENVRSPHVHIH